MCWVKSNIWNVLHLQAFKNNVFSLVQWPLIQVLLLVSDICWSAGIASEETFWGGKGWGHKVFLKSHHSDLFFIERLSHCISKRFPAPSLLNHCFFHVWVVEEYEEPMQYHLKSSCSSSKVKVQIQACTQRSGGKRLSAQVKVHYWYNILRP